MCGVTGEADQTPDPDQQLQFNPNDSFWERVQTTSRGARSCLNDGGCAQCTHDVQHATPTRSLPSVFGFGGVGPGTGGGDVRIWDGAILHPQGVATLSWRGEERWKRGVGVWGEGGERDRHQAVSHVLMSMEIRSWRKLIFPLERQQSSLVPEDNSVMSSLGKLLDFVLHEAHSQRGGGNSLENKILKYIYILLAGSCKT